MAAYYFPPFADVSGVRVTKFSKYLPQNGWLPTVLTVDPRYYGDKVLTEIPEEAKGMDVRRIPFLPLPGARVLVKLYFPLYVCWQALRERRRISVVYLCGSPFHPFASTAFITGLLRIPTVLDFRDFWSLYDGYDSHSSDERTPSIRFRAERLVKHFIEWIGIKYARRVVFASRVLKEEYAGAFPRFAHKFETVNNGYDPEDFQAVTLRRISETSRTLILTGKFLKYIPEGASAFFNVLREFPDVTFLYVGGEHEEVAAAAAQQGVEPQVTTLPFLPYRDVIELIAGADYGLVAHGVLYGMGTKIFDYMALGKPSLCLVPAGSIISSEFRSTPGILICETPHTEDKIRQGLHKLLSEGPTESIPELQNYSRAVLAASLAVVLEDAISGRERTLKDPNTAEKAHQAPYRE